MPQHSKRGLAWLPVRVLLWLRWPAVVCAVLLAAQTWYLGNQRCDIAVDLLVPMNWSYDAGSVDVTLVQQLSDPAWRWSGVRVGPSLNAGDPTAQGSAWTGWALRQEVVYVVTSPTAAGPKLQRPLAITVLFPVWPVCIGLLVYTVAAFLLRRRLRARPGECAGCGYVLPKSGVCPECGRGHGASSASRPQPDAGAAARAG